MKWLYLLPAAMLPLMLAGCDMESTQSALQPSGPAAAEIAGIWWFMFWVGTVVAMIVTVLMLVAIFARRRDDSGPPPGRTGFIVIGGIIFPAVILLILLFYALNTTLSIRAPDADLTIEVVGHKWWWEVRYPDHDIVTANELHIPAGTPVRLVLSSADVIHSFWVPRLHGKMDLFPDVTNHFWIQADEPGQFRGQCAEFCGVQHALMAFMVVALAPEEFKAWVEERSQPPSEPETDLLQRGHDAFFEASCDNCHAVRGTDAVATAGPDLTHIGSRLTLGAATIPNNHGNLAGWITDPQPIKPGNHMPPTHLSSEDLHALVAYLESLK